MTACKINRIRIADKLKMIHGETLKNPQGHDIRPITILNVFWRIWGAAWLQTVQVQQWIASLPKDICYGKGSNSCLAVGEIILYFRLRVLVAPWIMLRRMVLWMFEELFSF